MEMQTIRSPSAGFSGARVQRPTPRLCVAHSGKFAMPGAGGKVELVENLLQAKEKSGKTFTEIAKETGLTNVYVAQLFTNQSQLKPQYVSKLQAAVPALTAEQLSAMQLAPSRRFDPLLIQEPTIYRLYEAIMHGGEGLKAIINEECGDGIMSAIDFYCSIDKMPGKHGETRVVITMNGKYLPFVVQSVEDDVAHRK